MSDFTTIDSLREIHRRLTELVNMGDGSMSTRIQMQAEAVAFGLRLTELEREMVGHSAYHLNANRSVVVLDKLQMFFTDDPENLPPRGAKMLVLGPGDSTTLTNYDGDPQWSQWFPLPDKRKR